MKGTYSHLSRNNGGEGGAPGDSKDKINSIDKCKINYPTLRQRRAEG
jgi:hypothetical protein